MKWVSCFRYRDLPTQVGDIENNELRVLQSQLADIQTEQEEDEHGDLQILH